MSRVIQALNCKDLQRSRLKGREQDRFGPGSFARHCPRTFRVSQRATTQLGRREVNTTPFGSQNALFSPAGARLISTAFFLPCTRPCRRFRQRCQLLELRFGFVPVYVPPEYLVKIFPETLNSPARVRGKTELTPAKHSGRQDR